MFEIFFSLMLSWSLWRQLVNRFTSRNNTGTTTFRSTMAAVSSFTDDLEAQLTCVICNDIFTDPRTLPCLHTFCFKCIKSWNEACQRESKRLRCPTCRAVVNVEGDDMSNLLSSVTFNSLLQLFNVMKTMTDKQSQQQLPECVGCNKRSKLVGFCPQCEGMICNECINHHKTIKPLIKTHQATLWSEFKTQNVNSYINNQAICKEKFHQKCRLDYCYCNTCKKCICKKCSATAHSSHVRVSIEEAAEDAKKLIRKEKERLNELLIGYKKELELSNENMTRIQSEVDAAEAKVRNHIQALMEILQDRKNALIFNLDGFLAEQKTANEDEKKDIDANIQQVTELKHQCKTMEEKNLEKFILESYENLLEVCKATAQNKSVLSTKPVKRNSTVCYIPNPEVIPLMRKFKFGEIVESVTDPSRCSMESLSEVRCGFINELVIVTRNSQGDICHTNKGSIDVQIQDVDGNNVQKELTATETGIFLVKYKAEKPSPYKVVVSIGGKEIKNSPQNIETIDAKAEFKPLKIIDVKERISNLIALDVCGSDPIAMVNTYEKDFRVVLFNADGEYLRDIGGAGSGDGQLSHPCGVIFNEDKIVITDNPDDCGCVNVFDIDGTYKRTLCKLPQGILSKRMCTANQTIACLCYNTNTKEIFIKFFDKKSYDHIYDIKLDVPHDVHWMPFSLAYDSNKYFVSFYTVSIVYVFDENGGLLYTFGMKGNKEGKFNFARGLAVFGKEMLLVCDRDNHRVQVFSQDGQVIRSFGSEGSGLGQMNGPYDVSVTPDGRVFVLEWRGKRVQVWR